MNEELELLKLIAVRLKSAGIEYMMTGSMAMAIYSTPRMTRDIDLIVQIGVIDIRKIVDLFKDDFFIDEAGVRQAVSNQGMFNIIHNDSIVKADFIVRKNEEYRIEEFSRKRSIDLEGVSISVVAPEDLIISKLIWARHSGSDFQIRDVRQLIMTLTDLDKKYIEKWSRRLGVYESLVRAGFYE
jgi:hypothetical protein